MGKIALLMFFLFCLVFSTRAQIVEAASGDFTNIGTAGGTDGSSDAISWSPGFPIMIDAYGKYIVMENRSTGSNYKFEYNNDGATWSETTNDTGYGVRASSIYDSVNDKIHVIVANSSSVKYYRYTIKRDKNYNITDIIADSSLTAMTLDSIGSCTSFDAEYPLVQLKDNSSNGILVASWSTKKTCAGVDITETRASMRVLSNSSADGTAGNWVALNGSDDSGTATGPASVAFNILYHYAGSATHKLQQSMFIRGGSGSKSNDIYYFNADENDTNGFRRLSWNSGSSNWSGSWTARVTFGGDVGNSNGYNLKNELISKPVYDAAHDKVYIGIARWLEITNGDTQSLYYIDSSDTATLAGNVYSAGGTAWFAPTMDIMYNADDQKLYYFFETSDKDPNSGSTDTSLEGKGFYKTYDGTSFSTATQFFSVSGKTIDIPIVYQSAYLGRILLVFRADGAETPYTPPHNVYWGYLDSGGATTRSQSISSPYSASTYSEFDKLCVTETDTEQTANSDGEISLQSSFRDDFSSPLAPYTSIASQWTTGTWAAGSFAPTPTGTVNVWGTGGAYMYGNSTFSKKTLEFRAEFTNNNFQHIGWDDTNGFNTFIIFSTNNNGQLNARVNGTQYTLGASYLGSYHTYKITWADSDIKFYIDGSQVASDTSNITTSLNPIISNNTTTSGADLLVDWINVTNYPTTSGTFVSCGLDSGVSGAVWGSITYTASASGVVVATRTSADNSTWSSWSGSLASGDSIPTTGQYLQYRISLTGTSITTPTFDQIAFSFSSPTPTPTPQSNSSGSSSSSSSTSPASCTEIKPVDTPNLFQIDVSDTKATVYFAPIAGATNYSLVFGYSPGDERFNASFSTGVSSGVLSYTINDLSPQTTYYIKVRGAHNCMPGNFGNEMKITTARKSTIGGIRYYKDFLARILSIFPKNVTTIASSPMNQASSSCTYTVRAGDSLWSLAEKKLGSGSNYTKIVESNKILYPSLSKSTLIRAGWVLKIGC